MDPEEEERIKAALRVIAASVFVGLLSLIVVFALIFDRFLAEPMDVTTLMALAGMMLYGFGAIVGVTFKRPGSGEDDE